MIIQFEFETCKSKQEYQELFGASSTLSLSEMCEILEKDTASLGKPILIFTDNPSIQTFQENRKICSNDRGGII